MYAMGLSIDDDSDDEEKLTAVKQPTVTTMKVEETEVTQYVTKYNAHIGLQVCL